MTIRYHYFKNPGKDDKQIHPRVVEAKRITKNEIAEKVTAKCSFTTSDVKGVMDAVKDVIIDELSQGNYIHWEDFANFFLLLSSDYTDEGRELTPSRVKIKGINCQLLPEVKKEMNIFFEFERSARYSHTIPSPTLRQHRILNYLKENKIIQGKTAAAINACSRSTASKDLREMLKAGLIRSQEGFGQALYILPTNETL